MVSDRTATKDFSFKQFTVHGGFSGMPVSTDGVLLGSWIQAAHNATILDIGTGTGLLSLMCAQRFYQADIHAIEIDKDAYEAASHNFSQSPWHKRLQLTHADILSWTELFKLSNNLFDTIICNPPYFNQGQPSKLKQRATARHTDSLPHRDLLQSCQKVLKLQGKANFILPRVEGEAFITVASTLGWRVSRLCQVSPTEFKAVNRLLIELCRQDETINSKQLETEHSKLMINQSGKYSDNFVALTKAFYLKM
ncbi:methyltransferase [Vibrio sp. TH_r3]|uniref:tRNA1(Val) (adenine(37)-N6)-methyltransferase n=1 Tax=Vibrio sp. TH_r3 TaxID=3082084 RepID=UPI00295369D4|nr:methyltransferase [Vibrio sp. TH_r3]MDV7105216.1 methyltransferase [Vibrio sp. TH_r3]